MCVSCVEGGMYVCVFILCVVQECVHPMWRVVYISLVPRLFSSSACERKEPGNIGVFKLLTSAGSDRAPPIRLQDEIMGMNAFLKAWQTKVTQTKINRLYN